MPARKLSVKRPVLLVAAVFLVGAAIGALLSGVLHRSGGGRRVVIERTVTRTAGAGAARGSTPVRPAPKTAAPMSSGAPAADGTRTSFRALAARLPGAAGVAVAPLAAGPIETFGAVQVTHAWSTSKVPVLVTLLHDDETSGRALGDAAAAEASLALEQSDNAAVEALFARLEQIHGGLVGASGAVQQALRRAGDRSTVINTAPNDEGFTTYGQTEWSLSGEVTFYRALARGCLLDRADTDYVLELMRRVTDSQRWGAGSAGYPSTTPVAFKGGWGPDDKGRYQVRQTAIIGAGGRGYVVSMLALPASGAFADGTAMITALAGWARRQFNSEATGPSAQCVAAE